MVLFFGQPEWKSSSEFSRLPLRLSKRQSIMVSSATVLPWIQYSAHPDDQNRQMTEKTGLKPFSC